jgi:hypothetical protein
VLEDRLAPSGFDGWNQFLPPGGQGSTITQLAVQDHIGSNNSVTQTEVVTLPHISRPGLAVNQIGIQTQVSGNTDSVKQTQVVALPPISGSSPTVNQMGSQTHISGLSVSLDQTQVVAFGHVSLV